MKSNTSPIFALLFLGLQPAALSQPAVDLSPTVQNVIDRQAERAQTRAAESALRQAEAVQDRAVERAAAQADAVQGQALERVENQVERVQSRAAEQAQAQVERVQSQAAERAAGQVDRVQERAAGRAQDQAERLEAQAAERIQRQAERAQQRAEGLDSGLPAAAAPGQARAEAAAAAAGTPALPERLPVRSRNGDPVFVEIDIEPAMRAIEYEWVMLVDGAQRRRLDDEAPELLEFLVDTDAFDATDGELLTFRVPPDLDAGEAILELVPDDLESLIDRNHVYSAQSGEAGAVLARPAGPVCMDSLAIGMIDSAVEAAHPAFAGMRARGTQLHWQDFVGTGLVQPAGHGTAVAGRLVGSGGGIEPLLPGATVYGAAVMYAREGHAEGATAVHLLRALDWLIAQEVSVINMSLAGPPNKLLERTLQAAAAAGKTVVAAAGNQGPHAPPLYPAAYDGVIGVTAVARDASVYRWANQGDHVDYAALGVEIPVALAGGGFGEDSGTSLSAPVVSAALACALAHGGGDLGAALEQLREQLIDLGEPGRDRVFGHGLLHPLPLSPAP